MLILYWLTAFIIAVVMSTITAMGITFAINLTLQKDLPYSHRRIWRWFQNFIVFISNFIVTLSRKPFEVNEEVITGWPGLWVSLEQLMIYQLKWLVFIVIFWLAISYLVIIFP